MITPDCCKTFDVTELINKRCKAIYTKTKCRRNAIGLIRNREISI